MLLQCSQRRETGCSCSFVILSLLKVWLLTAGPSTVSQVTQKPGRHKFTFLQKEEKVEEELEEQKASNSPSVTQADQNQPTPDPHVKLALVLLRQ